MTTLMPMCFLRIPKHLGSLIVAVLILGGTVEEVKISEMYWMITPLFQSDGERTSDFVQGNS